MHALPFFSYSGIRQRRRLQGCQARREFARLRRAQPTTNELLLLLNLALSLNSSTSSAQSQSLCTPWSSSYDTGADLLSRCDRRLSFACLLTTLLFFAFGNILLPLSAIQADCRHSAPLLWWGVLGGICIAYGLVLEIAAVVLVVGVGGWVWRVSRVASRFVQALSLRRSPRQANPFSTLVPLDCPNPRLPTTSTFTRSPPSTTTSRSLPPLPNPSLHLRPSSHHHLPPPVPRIQDHSTFGDEPSPSSSSSSGESSVLLDLPARLRTSQTQERKREGDAMGGKRGCESFDWMRACFPRESLLSFYLLLIANRLSRSFVQVASRGRLEAE